MAIESDPEREETPAQDDGAGDEADEATDSAAASASASAAAKPGSTLSVGASSRRGDDKARSKSPMPVKTGPLAEIRRLAAARGVDNPLWAKDVEIGLFTEHRDVVNCLAWNPKNLDVLASGSADGTVKLWDFHRAENQTSSTSTSTSTSTSSAVALRNTKKPIMIPHKSIESNQKAVTAISWHPDGTMIATGCQDGVGRLSTPLGQLQGIMSYGRGAVTALKFSPGGKLILMAKADFTTTLWALVSDYNQRIQMRYETHTSECGVLVFLWFLAECVRW